jgi:integrase
LRFLHREQYHQKDLSHSVPRVHCGRTSKLPNIWTPEEVERILQSVDRGTSEGKRDYAILLLVTHLGLRDGDVQNLKFENICWEECLIRLNQMKTGRLLELPLREDIGNAIIDYLKYGRPTQDTSQYVFIRHKVPYGKCNNYYYIMKKYLSAAKIQLDTTKLHGLHTLRHTLATRLLEQQVPLHTISQILGHTSINSTNVYLRVDLNALRECALNPEEVFVNG